MPANKVYLSPAVADVVVDDFVRGGTAGGVGGASAFNTLSPREREVLQLVAEGKATKQVAIILHVSIKTVETHRKNLMEKLGLDSVAELTKVRHPRRADDGRRLNPAGLRPTTRPGRVLS